uniref:Protease Do-like 2, chloroplastic n=1 Tax=Nicotiana tabacum TaxID=4097 RepID=A0A1S4AXX8_TOBAC|nr:PREDICTED: protease Do-like 2, chloroplastic [Nicotiana tabacum]
MAQIDHLKRCRFNYAGAELDRSIQFDQRLRVETPIRRLSRKFRLDLIVSQACYFGNVTKLNDTWCIFQGDVIVSFDGVHVGSEGTVPFRSSERIAFRYLISQKFSGDSVELGIIRAGEFMKVQAVLKPRVHLVPYHIEGGQPSYIIVAGLVFTPLSEPLIEEEEDSIGLKLLTKARYSLAKFEGQQIVVLSQVLANEVNIGYEDMSNEQVLKLNGTRIKNIHHLAHLVDSCKGKYLVFEFEDNFLVVLEREAALDASASILKDYGIPAERSSDLMGAYVDSIEQSEATNQQNFGDSPVSNMEFGSEGLLWA